MMTRIRYPTSTVGSFPQPNALRQARISLKAGEISVAAYQNAVREYSLEWVKFQNTLSISVFVGGEFERDDMAAYFGEYFGGRRLDFVPSYGNRRYRPIEYFKNIEHPGKSILADSFRDLKAAANGVPVKETITGPATMADWAIIEQEMYYKDRRKFRMDFARALRAEIDLLIPHGLEILQIDEPALTTSMDNFEMDIGAIRETVKGLETRLYLVLHICFSSFDALDMAFPQILELPFHQIHMELANRKYSLLSLIEKYGFGGKAIGAGVFDSHKGRVETVDEMVYGIKKVKEVKGPDGSSVFRPDQIWLMPDCGLKTGGHEFTIEDTKNKLRNMAAAAKICRAGCG
jgi:5-methyltetrahydropteroyltriglutamate--homocysteine methyltransferase